MKSGSLNIREPSGLGLSRPVMGLLYLFYSIIYTKNTISDPIWHTLKGFEESAELMIKQQFTGLLGAQLWVLGGLTVQLVPRDFPHFVQKCFQA